MKTFRPIAALVLAATLAAGCGIYSFSGTSIQPDVETITINYFEYKAQTVNPSLSNKITEDLRTQFRKMTRLEQVDIDGDLEIEGEITDYRVEAAAITAYETRASNVPWTFCPTIDLSRNQVWPRCWENFGEDAYVNSAMAEAAVTGFQGTDPNHINNQHISVSFRFAP